MESLPRHRSFGVTLVTHLTTLAMIGLGLTGCGSPEATQPPRPSQKSTASGTSKPAAGKDMSSGEAHFVVSTAKMGKSEASPFRFAEIASQAGVDFTHVSGMTKERYFPTANGSGVALFDYNGDGLMDLYFASNCFLPLGSRPEGQNRLFKNLGGGKFQDVTQESGLGFHGFCHGVIAADFDNDGDTDLFLATYHQNTFFLNNGDGTFRNVGREAGVTPPAFHGRLVARPDAPASITIDAVSGLRWQSGGEPSDDLTVPVRKGQTIAFRQADPTAPRALDLLIDPAHVQRLGDAEKPEAWLREMGRGDTRLAKPAPPLAEGAAPVVLAEFQVLVDLPEPVAFQCAVHRPDWSSGGAALDFDNDGDLDIYVSNYGWWTVEQHGSKFCGNREKNVRQYCSPKEVGTVKHLFYRNDGLNKDGVPQFTNVYDEIFVDRDGNKIPGPANGHGFGVVAADLNGDGLVDLHVANDQNPAFLFINNGNGTFTDRTEDSGAAYDEKGSTQSGMGVDAEDIDGDGQPELFRTHFANEYNTLYQNLGEATFYDQTAAYGLAADAMPWVKWGCALGDFDNDGWPDCFVACGHVDDNYAELGINNVPYAHPPLLFRNVALGKGPRASRRFRLSIDGVGPYFATGHVSRGAAFGDFNNDGKLDIVINQKDGPAALLQNETPGGHWIRFKLRGTRSNRDAIGTRIQVIANGQTIVRQRKGGCSLESTSDPRVLIGVGDAERLETVLVHWPSGVETVLKDVPTDQQLDLVEPEPGTTPPAQGTP